MPKLPFRLHAIACNLAAAVVLKAGFGLARGLIQPTGRQTLCVAGLGAKSTKQAVVSSLCAFRSEVERTEHRLTCFALALKQLRRQALYSILAWAKMRGFADLQITCGGAQKD